MTPDEAMEIVIGRTGVGRYRELCDEGNPDVEQRDAYRALMVRMADPDYAPIVVAADDATPEDVELRAFVARQGGCCG